MTNKLTLNRSKVLRLLAKNRWTYTDLANKMGRTRQLVSLHLMGKHNIRLTTLYLFADALQVDAEYLMVCQSE